jgi:hypothetical protein
VIVDENVDLHLYRWMDLDSHLLKKVPSLWTVSLELKKIQFLLGQVGFMEKRGAKSQANFKRSKPLKWSEFYTKHKIKGASSLEKKEGFLRIRATI